MLFCERGDDLGQKNLTTCYMQVFCHVTGFMSDFRSPKTSVNICVVHDNLGWKNRTTRYNRFWRAGCSQLEYVYIRSAQYINRIINI